MAIRVGGCAKTKKVASYVTEFDINDIAYVRAKAILGKLEKVVIKKINLVPTKSPTCMGVETILNYVDSFNAVWLNGELVNLETATTLAIEALQDQANLHASYASQFCSS